MNTKFLRGKTSLLFALWILCTQVIAAPLSVGEKAPDFALKLLDGSEFNLSDYHEDKSVYLIFWNTWCGPCMKKAPKLVEIQGLYGEQVKLLAINTSWSDSLSDITQFQFHFSTNYPIAFDHDAEVTHRYGVLGTPTGFLIDINGVIRQVDGITDTLSANIAQWNQIAHQGGDELIASEGCSKENVC
ncbi:redoxin family protein [Shewanella sp. D64]|uniref:peroxiredoxin family protein n=1 Tax=unclassified Shewanella TaxID=196818 RepID=UPI0022BA2110|nr:MULTISPECIES: redoxin domain-containing protein [unclassified Shewanella]MEC4725153.1 redoxin family protein [Shewanella sp. D64]MEC4737054.1 redoxin family protein [Shewanella sp. E94]WBJ96639.1 redoxin family protein [Shewanella sp. MTB7]